MPKRKRKSRSTNASGYFGVTLKASKRYKAQIRFNGKMKGLGTYDTAKQAAKAYDAAAIELGRPLSKLNFPKKVPPGSGYTVTSKELPSNNTSGYRGAIPTRGSMDMKHRSRLKAKSHILASSTQPNKLPLRTIMLFTTIAYQNRS